MIFREKLINRMKQFVPTVTLSYLENDKIVETIKLSSCETEVDQITEELCEEIENIENPYKYGMYCHIWEDCQDKILALLGSHG